MGNYYGKKQPGKVFSVIRSYFDSAAIDSIHGKSELEKALLDIYNRRYPDDAVGDSTGLYDGVRCLAGIKNGPLERVRRGEYQLRRFFKDEDDKAFQRNYHNYSCKGKKHVSKSQKSASNEGLSELGSANTEYVYDNPSSEMLETFDNAYQNRNYVTEFEFPEFTSLCPKTGQPDFATIKVQYVPDAKCIETKSLKLYFLAFRQYGSFMETIVNKILEDCVSICDPRWMKVIGWFNARGGTFINVEAEYDSAIS